MSLCHCRGMKRSVTSIRVPEYVPRVGQSHSLRSVASSLSMRCVDPSSEQPHQSR